MAKFFAVMHLVNEYVVETTITVGPSMLPTLAESGDLVLVDKTVNLPFGLGARVKAGDVVVARSPTNAKMMVCKRVRAMPGERNPMGRRMAPGQVWIEGDNANNSTDSRTYGPIPEALIEGRVVWRLWPLAKAGRLPQPSSLTEPRPPPPAWWNQGEDEV